MILSSIIVIFNLILIESMLSVDNAAVLALMVRNLQPDQRSKALKYGIWGAFLLRGSSLFCAAWLTSIGWLKIAGGVYLLYLALQYARSRGENKEEGVKAVPSTWLSRWIGPFWSTVVLVEIMDMVFSIDNIFASVALSNNIYLIITGVFIGMIAMRYVASWFVLIMEQYPSLEPSAYIAIMVLGLKIIYSGLAVYIPAIAESNALISGQHFDLILGGLLLVIFFLPIVIKNRHE